MRTLTRGKAAIAAIMAVGLALVATPAVAAEGDAVLTVPVSEFSAGSWGTGVNFTLTGVPEGATEVTVGIGAMGENGGGSLGESEAVIDVMDPTIWTGNVLPDSSPVAPDMNGFPKYTAYASYTLPNSDTLVTTNKVELTILPGMSVTGPMNPTVADLAAGVELQFVGFAPDETLTGAIEYYNMDSDTWQNIGQFSATMGADGSGMGTLTVTGAPAGTQIRVTANGLNGSVEYYVTIAADATTPPPTAPAKPVRIETGV